MPYGNHDQNIQSRELPHENIIRHQTGVLRSYQTNIFGPKGYVLHRLALKLYRKDQRNYQTMVERRGKCVKIK